MDLNDLTCEKCGEKVRAAEAFLRVTGWIDSQATPAKRIVTDISAPHGAMCRLCAKKAATIPVTTSLFG